MKHTLRTLLAILLALSFVACSTPAVTTTPFTPTTPPPAATITPPVTVTPPPAAVVTFNDPVLEEMVRGAMGKPEGQITVAEAATITRLNLSNDLQRYISGDTAIKDISGLEHFTNLESLDLSFHGIADASPLGGLTKLTLLALDGNPVTDISPLASLTDLKVLSLSNIAAQNYSPLEKLVKLEFLRLDNTPITDGSPLASLANLKHLYLANCPVDDYSPLANLYPNLETRDFTIAATLKELGFSMDDGNHQAIFNSDHASITINHSKWGVPPWEWDRDIVRVSTYLEGDYKLAIGFYGDLNAYVVIMNKDRETVMNYVYDSATASFTFGVGDRESSEQAVRAAMEVVEGEDALLAPISILNKTIKQAFHMTADALYALPFEPPTLKSLGFFPDEGNAVWRYEQRGERDVNIEIHRPEWGEKEYDFRFFTPLSDEYRIVVTYLGKEKKFMVGADDNNLGGAKFDYYIETNEHIDEWCSEKDMTVEEYFIKAYNDPEIKDIYLHSVELLMQYFKDTFGMTIEELYTLPTGE